MVIVVEKGKLGKGEGKEGVERVGVGVWGELREEVRRGRGAERRGRGAERRGRG